MAKGAVSSFVNAWAIAWEDAVAAHRRMPHLFWIGVAVAVAHRTH